MRVLCVLLLCLVGLSACHTVRPVYTGDDWSHVRSQVQVGNVVYVTTKEGQKLDFKVTDINDEGISGESVHVDRADIQSVKVREFNASKTTRGVALSAGVILLIVAVGGLILLGASF